MEEEKKCKQCGKVTAKDFQFCPYCGTLILDFEDPQNEDDHEVQGEKKLEKLGALEASLDVLESEISQFLNAHVQ